MLASFGGNWCTDKKIFTVAMPKKPQSVMTAFPEIYFYVCW